MPEEKNFKRSLGFIDSTMVVAGSMIGSGIFIVSADMARTVGSAGYLILLWLVTGIITVFAALSYGELSGMMPKAGGQYVYLQRAYNPLIGFLYGWTLFMVIQTGVIAAVAVAFAKFTAVFIPEMGTDNILLEFGPVSISAAQILAISSIVLLSLINSNGIKNGKIIQDIFTSTKILALLALIIIGISLGMNSDMLTVNFKNAWEPATIDPGTGTVIPLIGNALIAAFGVAMIGSLFSSDAWNSVTFISGEIKDPQKNIPRSLFFGTLIVTIVYILANVAYLCLLPLKGDPLASDALGRGIQFAVNDRVGTAAASVIFGNTAVFIMAALIMISTFGCNNGLILSGARVYYAMAKDKLFFKKAGTLNKHEVPGFALILQCIWASVLCLSGTYGDLLDYTTFASLIFYIITIGAVFILRKKEPDAERPYRAWGYPVVPALYILIAAAICIDLLIFRTRNTGIGLLIVLLGIPIYYLNRRKEVGG